MTYVRPRSTRPVRALPGVTATKVYRVRKARGVLARRPADRATSHVRYLLGLGLTKESIARAAGIGSTTITKLTSGQQLIDWRIESAILAVSHTPDPRQALCLAVGARRRAYALARIGWALSWQAEQLGKAPQNFWRELLGPRITYSTWVAVRVQYDRLSMTPGPSAKARQVATANGWPPPLAWDDDDIDDPNAQPDARPRTTVRDSAATAEDVEFVLRHQPLATSRQIAERFGYADPSAVQNACLRAGRTDLLERLARNATLEGAA